MRKIGVDIPHLAKGLYRLLGTPAGLLLLMIIYAFIILRVDGKITNSILSGYHNAHDQLKLRPNSEKASIRVTRVGIAAAKVTFQKEVLLILLNLTMKIER
jgi:hypothetical protein